MRQDINFLRQLAAMGEITPAELDQAEQENYLRTLTMPERPDVPDVPMNAMRDEQTGKVTSLDFGGPRPQPQAQKLGEPVDVVGRGRGRYTADGRGVQFADGSVQDLHPNQTMKDFERWFTMAKGKQGLERGEVDMARDREAIATSQAQRAVREDPTSQPFLERRFGKAEKGYQWTPDGTQIPKPGGTVEQGAQTDFTNASETVRKIDEMIGQRDAEGNLLPGSKPHPGFETAVGVTGLGGGFGLAGLFPGTDTTDFKTRLDELKGGAFLKAFETLKGGGQITQIEGEKATAAITRMNKSQSEAEFVKAAMEFRNIVQTGLQRAQQQMRGGQPANGGGVQVGEVRRGYRFKGGNPASQSSWEKVQ